MVCKLCYTHQETTLHMLARCPYSNAIWQGLQGWLGITLQRPPRNSYDPVARERAQKVMYMAWDIWKEQCMRVFDNKGLDVVALQGLILHDVAQGQTAWRSNALARGATT
jgi:hypothetical protein